LTLPTAWITRVTGRLLTSTVSTLAIARAWSDSCSMPAGTGGTGGAEMPARGTVEVFCFVNARERRAPSNINKMAPTALMTIDCGFKVSPC